MLGKPQLPDFPTPRRRRAAADGRVLPHRLATKASRCASAQLYPDAAERERERPRYVERLDFEIETILKMGFPGYFLIVADFINWARSHGCPVGPGRGSGAGSLVAYSLNITDLDPLRYELLFERFLNPERVSMPDFDIDFCQANRDRVIDYVKQQVRPRRGQPDRHLRHDGRQGGAARHRPRARHELRPCRLDRQARAGAAGQDGDAGQAPPEQARPAA